MSFLRSVVSKFIPLNTRKSPASSNGLMAKQPLVSVRHNLVASSAKKNPVDDSHLRANLRRDRLAAVIRETMHANSFKATDYRFKVLTVSNTGYEFIALVETIEAIGERILNLPHLGAAIVHESRYRFGVLVKGVYWQMAGEKTAINQVKFTNSTPAAIRPRTQAEEDFDREMERFVSRSSAKGRPADTHSSDVSAPSAEELHEFKTAISSTMYGGLS